MHFFLRPSYHPSWRVFANQDKLKPEVYEFLKKTSRWGGHDKEEQHDDTPFLGFEFSDGLKASEALVECFKLMGQTEE